MAEILLEPLDGGDTVPIPDEKTTIGRGPFLQVCVLWAREVAGVILQLDLEPLVSAFLAI